VDFCVNKGRSSRLRSCKIMLQPILWSFPDLDHTNSVYAEPILSNRNTNWDDFRLLVNERLTLDILLKAKEDTEAAAKFFNYTCQCTDWNATPEYKDTQGMRLLYNN
jgi:hypothetical protein